ncbi:MAG TPA: hypothetical protein VIS10_12405 [Anaerolineales bacterium]
MTDKRPSKRFKPTTWMERLVPLLLGLLALALLAVFVVVVLAVLGLTPGA